MRSLLGGSFPASHSRVRTKSLYANRKNGAKAIDQPMLDDIN